MFKIIQELKRSDPKRRQKLLFQTHEKNVAYFKQVNPELGEFIEKRGTGTYMIEVTDNSINVRDAKTKKLFHPPGELFQYMNDFGYWHHSGWIDKTAIAPVARGQSEHGLLIVRLVEALHTALPVLRERIAEGVVALPALTDGRRYSGPTLFLGVFTGLHAMAYLNRTVLSNVVFFEPDLDKFAVSCYFVDYEQIQRRFGNLLLHAGDEAPQNTIAAVVNESPVTSPVWLRMLPAYPDGKFDDVINRVSLRWRSLIEIFVPFDREQRNLQYAVQNIKDRYPFPKQPPKLSANSVICVLASGPSLGDDMEWVKRNQDRMIIMCSISSYRVIKENGIRVDLQCTLDTEIDEPLIETLALDTDITLATYYKLDPKILKRFRKALMIPEDNKANAVRFFESFPPTHPTTGNLITAIAVWAKPATLLFVGTDFGYKDKALTHVKGSWYDDNDGAGHIIETRGRDHIQIKANFEESEGQIVTTSYYNSARAGVESALEWLKDTDIKIVNASDGARVVGAKPMRTTEFELPDYPEKVADIQAIEDAFSSDYDGIFESYQTPGRLLIESMAKSMLEVLDMEKFDWQRFAHGLDISWTIAIRKIVNEYREFRMEMFAKLLYDLLGEWYRAMVLTHTAEETELVYRAGLKEFKNIVENLPWPEDLDSLMDAPPAESGGAMPLVNADSA